jgi:hypothetical protein
LPEKRAAKWRLRLDYRTVQFDNSAKRTMVLAGAVLHCAAPDRAVF